MFLYLFLTAALVSSFAESSADTASKDTSADTSENTYTNADAIHPELQEIIALFAEEANTQNTTLASVPATISVASEQDSIIITNAIQPSMIAYKHWTGTYSPDIFTITVNGVEVAQGAQHTLPATRDPIEIRYDYSFVNGKRTGAKVVSYQLNENTAAANITFSWNDDWRVLVDNGTAVKQEEISQT